MKYRTLWISDLHLGTRHSSTTELLEFLKNNEFEIIYIVGDFIDFWQLKHKHYWPQSHNDIIQKLLRKSRKGTSIIYIPGNHDEFVSEFIGDYGNVSIKKNHIHTTIAGKRYIIIHGHEFDLVTTNMKWLSILGDFGYQLLLQSNRPVNMIRNWLDLEPWSLSSYIKNRVKMVVNVVGNFEKSVSHYAKTNNVHGIICGHIHTPTNKIIDGYDYWNCGDWVESCTAIVEDFNGKLEIKINK